MIRAILGALVCGLSIPVLTAASWKVDGKPVPDTAWAKSDGDFGAQLVFTDKPDELFAAWEKPGPAVMLSETPTAVRGLPIVGVIFFAGCGANERGKCEASVRFTAETPDGKPWGEPVDGELWIDKPPPDKGQMQLSVGNMGIIIDPGDPLGVYKVKAAITDKVTKKKMVLERAFTAVEAPPKGQRQPNYPLQPPAGGRCGVEVTRACARRG